MFNKVGIVGVGLIGGSIALSLKKKNLAKYIIGYDKSEVNLDKALDLGVIDEKSSLNGISTADFVVVSTPVSTISDYVINVLSLNKKTVVIDVGSVKKSIVDEVLGHFGENVNYIPMHPIAGTENFGPEAAFDNLFEGAYCIVTPYSGMSESLLSVGRELAKSLGMIVKVMSPDLHDEVFGYVSHLPHVIAYTLVHLVSNKSEEFRFVGGGFRDYTRVAVSSEHMWRDIFLKNKDNVLKAVFEYIDQLKEFANLVKNGKEEQLIEYLKQARIFKITLDG